MAEPEEVRRQGQDQGTEAGAAEAVAGMLGSFLKGKGKRHLTKADLTVEGLSELALELSRATWPMMGRIGYPHWPKVARRGLVRLVSLGVKYFVDETSFIGGSVESFVKDLLDNYERLATNAVAAQPQKGEPRPEAKPLAEMLTALVAAAKTPARFKRFCAAVGKLDEKDQLLSILSQIPAKQQNRFFRVLLQDLDQLPILVETFLGKVKKEVGKEEEKKRKKRERSAATRARRGEVGQKVAAEIWRAAGVEPPSQGEDPWQYLADLIQTAATQTRRGRRRT